MIKAWAPWKRFYSLGGQKTQKQKKQGTGPVTQTQLRTTVLKNSLALLDDEEGVAAVALLDDLLALPRTLFKLLFFLGEQKSQGPPGLNRLGLKFQK